MMDTIYYAGAYAKKGRMAQYTKLLKNDIQEITSKYQLEITSFEGIEQGAGNSNYLVNTEQGKYILTVFEIEPIYVVNMCKVLLLLEKYAYPAPRIHYLPNGDMLTNHQGKPVLMKPFITGQVVDDIDEDQANQLGRALARLHEIPVLDDLPEQHGYMVKGYPQVIKMGSNQDYIHWIRNKYRDLFHGLPSGLPSGLIHGDLFFDNVIFEGKKFKAILDFEDVCHYFKAFDIGMAIVGLCREGTSVALPKANAFISGYQGIRRLKGEEMESLQAFTEFAAILTSAWRYWKYNIDTPDAKKSNIYLEMVNLAKEIAAIKRTVFLESVFG